MSSTKIYTASEILEERQRARSNGIIAHTPKADGEFMARVGCTCYNCRDVIDPTGEEDAKARNEQTLRDLCEADNVPQLKLKRQYASCLDCREQHSCTEVCHPTQQSHLSLPPPPPAIRQCNYCRLKSDSGLSLSPIVGIQSPCSPSGELKCIEETYLEMESQLRRQLYKVTSIYQKLQAHIENQRDIPGTKHDEMAAYDSWSDEVEKKEMAIKELLDLLEE